MKLDTQIDLNHLAIFCKLAVAKNLTEAAKSLSVGKTGLSKVLKNIEENMGCELIYRNTRTYQLTQQGQELFDKLSPLMRELEFLGYHNNEQGLQNGQREQRGHIRLTAAHGVSTLVLPHIMAKYLEQNPNITFDLVNAQNSLKLIEEGIDLAFRFGKLEDSSLKSLNIEPIESIFVASPQYMNKMNLPEDLESFKEHQFLLLKHHHDHGIKLKHSADVLELKAMITNNSPLTLKDLCLEHLGISLLPKILVHSELYKGKLIEVMHKWPVEEIPFSIVYSYNSLIPPHVQHFAHFFKKSFLKLHSTNKCHQ